MASYEYRCATCEEDNELPFPFGQAPQQTSCPKCDAQMKKIFGKLGPAVIFKGTGWAGKW
jgi:putative FmdB family regulatory protein